ncbi:MAG: trypsin-like peptidase domain-containing protein [Geminocystis sp.]|nr:trypsin-like peptidase domain-containing protein [Geminocystis sp.]HIK38677.1 trypsin-like peptidase domain-containing protein [Geminocystis sp. M7585_C2015_104]MCS7147648.1 trypsin-like peptidase domain-containing protein [Geminocystis sp.]MCX8078044.1 trypsin-like peptidase domain-containing protein [Geminocystis sp.]MDW8117286.1 HhoA/HhoB/HtrA family serine endopeptidase [Geminocystis sp.]
MRIPKPLRQFVSHLLALVVGMGLALGGMTHLTAQALVDESSVAQRNIPLTEESFVTRAVERAGNAVVRIDTEKIITLRPALDPFLDDPFFRQFFGDRFRALIPRERIVQGLGSGFIIDKNGIILTNAHVVSGADRVTVTLKDGRKFQGTVLGKDDVTDLAVVKINPQGQKLPVAILGDSDKVKVGDWAIAVGNPVGLDNTVTLGIISTLNRPSSQVGILDKRIDFLQTDAAINPGNSGGPLLNAWGEVIGINTAIRADATGIGFAIPINKAKELTPILAAGKQVPHPYIGIQMVNLTPELARQNNQDPNASFYLPEIEGILVVNVLPDSPAQAGGMRRGDVIIRVDNQPIKDATQLQRLVEKSKINQTLRFTVIRNNQQLELNIKTAQLRS